MCVGRGGGHTCITLALLCQLCNCYAINRLLPFIQESKVVVEKDLARSRKMVKDLLDEHLMVNAESEQKMENLNVSVLLA